MDPNYYTFYRGFALERILISSFLCIFCSFFGTQEAHAQLSGTYTIGGADANYGNFKQAIHELEREGVSGNVIFKVRPGTYYEQIKIREISGTSFYNQVVFEGETGDSTDVVVQYEDDYALHVIGATPLTFRSLTFSRNSGDVVYIDAGTTYPAVRVTLENNVFRGGETGAVIHTFAGGSYRYANDSHIYANNLIIGGEIGIRRERDSHLYSRRPREYFYDRYITIAGNTFTEQRKSILSFYAQGDVTISDNTIYLGEGVALTDFHETENISWNNNRIIPGWRSEPMAGTYTIGGEDGAFPGFTAAVTELMSRGISAPVTFKVRPGTYTEQVMLDLIPGSSCQMPVIFEGESGDSTDVILQYEGRHVVRLQGTDGVVIRNMTIAGSGTAIWIDGDEDGTHCITIEKNVLKAAETGSVINTRSNAMDNNSEYNYQHIYRDNLIQGGTTGITVYRRGMNLYNTESPVFNSHFEITGNTILGQSTQGIELWGVSYTKVNNNKIVLPEGDGTSREGIVVYNSWFLEEISGNEIAITGGYTMGGIITTDGLPEKMVGNKITLYGGSGAGISINGSGGKNTSKHALIANNMISYFGEGTKAGISMGGTNFEQVNILYNSILLGGTGEASWAVNLGLDPDGKIVLMNNVLANEAGGFAVRFQGNQKELISSDYNDLYTNGKFLVRWDDQEIRSLAQWQSLTGFDEHSVSVAPGFVSNTNLHIENNPALAGKAIFLEAVMHDIDGQKRDADFPDIGADEFSFGPVEPLSAVKPIVECITKNGDGTYTASFGYHNTSGKAVTIPLGERNSFNVMENAGQPVTFAPGRRVGAFYVVFDGSPLSWTLGDRSVTVDKSKNPCPVPIQPVQPIFECVTDLENGTFIASVGYNNPNSRSVAIAPGNNNTFSNGTNVGQPSIFPADRRAVGAFYVAFNGHNLSWTLGSRTATTSRNEKSCPIPISMAEPILECVSDNGNGTYTAHFAYVNPNSRTIWAPIGDLNRISGSTPDMGQPTLLKTGTEQGAFTMDFNGEDLSWHLLGTTVTASDDPALRCEGAAVMAKKMDTVKKAVLAAGKTEIQLFPNPFEEEITLLLEKEYSRISLRILTISGALVKEYQKHRNGGEVKLHLPNLQSGMYILEIQTDEGVNRIRIVKK